MSEKAPKRVINWVLYNENSDELAILMIILGNDVDHVNAIIEWALMQSFGYVKIGLL